jgi:hypothetical protein
MKLGSTRKNKQKGSASSSIIDAELVTAVDDDITLETNPLGSLESGPSDAEAALDLNEVQPQPPTSLLALSLSLDPEIASLRIPFVDGERSIDGKLAFIVPLPSTHGTGEEMYGIAIPHDFAAAITMESFDSDNNLVVRHLSPDDDDNEEIMQIMATQLSNTMGDEVKLQRTPRILTISGPLNKIINTENWQDEIMPPSIPTSELLSDEGNESIQSFREFMKQELGEEEYQKTLLEAKSADIDDDLATLFSGPTQALEGDDNESMMEMIQSLMRDIEEGMKESGVSPQGTESLSGSIEKKLANELKVLPGTKDLDHGGVALKLISYRFSPKSGSGSSGSSGNVYSLVHLLKPFALIGRYIGPREVFDRSDRTARTKSLTEDVYFELLSPQEAQLVIPRLEEICRDDLRAAGIEFAQA